MKRAVQLAVTCLLLIALAVPYAVAEPKAEDDLIRVLLTRFGSVSELSIGIYGAYSCEGIYFQRGVTLTIKTAASNDQVLLCYEGMTLPIQGPLILRRHRTEGENGLRMQGQLNLYTGDLTVTNANGALQLVLSIPIEEYLLGVLPWEMSSGFPLEALKAQAVAARTYALTRRNADRPYDVTDNTNDQVYAGTLELANVIRQAVSATAGLCVYYQGQPVTCYYTASNGGQTDTIEHVWGKSDLPTGYIRSKADPYDLENDESVVRQAQIPKRITEEELPALQALLKRQMSRSLALLGYSDDPKSIRIREILSIVPTDADNPQPDTLRFTLLIDALKLTTQEEEEVSFLTNEAIASPAPTTGTPVLSSLQNPIMVTVAIFPQLESALQLSINTRANELWKIRETDEVFIIEARRFGHGVGLSQRGAQRMAARYGWDYQRILHFYYDDIVIRKAPLRAVTPAPAFSAAFAITPGPVPTATPRPTLMPVTPDESKDERIVIVDGISEDSSLNLRAMPDTASDILMRLYYGQRLIVVDAAPAEGWLQVRTDVVTGFVMDKFVSPTE